MSTSGSALMAIDLYSRRSQTAIKKQPRPVAEQMLSIRVRDVRPLVEVNQQTIRLPQMGDSLSLLWRWRSGGCLGPEAAAAMNARQRQPREDRPAAEPRWIVEPPEAGIWIWSVRSVPNPAGSCLPPAGANGSARRADPGPAAAATG